MKEFLIKYLLYAAVYFALSSIFLTEEVIEDFCILLAKISYVIIKPIDPAVTIVGANLEFASGRFFEVIDECTATDYCGLLVAATLAYPGNFLRNVWGALMLCVAVQLLNIVRIVSLYFTIQWSVEHFLWVHTNLWPLFFGLDVAVLFLGWVWYQQRRTEHEVAYTQ